MVQVFQPSPAAMQMGQLGQALGGGLAKRLGLAEAENAFKLAGSDPMRLASAYARLASIPGMERAIGPMYEASLRQMKTQAAQQEISPATQQLIKETTDQRGFGERKEAPSLTTREASQELIRPALPMTQQEEINRGVEKFKNNPGFYENDINKALASAREENQRIIERSRAIQSAGTSQQAEQSKLKQELTDLNNKYGAGSIVPANVFNNIQNKALNAMLPKEEGGEGLTTQEATQKYIPELDEIARDYKAIDDLGRWVGVWESPENVISTYKNLQKKFEKEDDLENFADYLEGHNDLSPRMAYSQAYPIKQDMKVYSELKKLKKLDPIFSLKNPTTETKKINEDIASKMTKKSSPLSIAQYLHRKGYDPQSFINYLIDNKDQLGLTTAQARQLGKGSQAFPKINDVLLMSQIGVE